MNPGDKAPGVGVFIPEMRYKQKELDLAECFITQNALNSCYESQKKDCSSKEDVFIFGTLVGAGVTAVLVYIAGSLIKK